MKSIMKDEKNRQSNSKKIKGLRSPLLKKILMAVSIAMMIQLLFVLPVFADPDGASVIQSGFSTLLDIVKALVSAIGTIVLLWGLFEWGTSLQSPNGAEQSSAFKRIGGGLVMILAPQLISLFVSTG